MASDGLREDELTDGDSKDDSDATESVDASITDVARTSHDWSEDEKDQFFQLLVRHGRHNVTAIAEELPTKTSIDVAEYLSTLQRQLSWLQGRFPGYFDTASIVQVPECEEATQWDLWYEEKVSSAYQKDLARQLRAAEGERVVSEEEEQQLRLFRTRRGERIAKELYMKDMPGKTLVTTDAWLCLRELLCAWLERRIGDALSFSEERARITRTTASEITFADMEQAIQINSDRLQGHDEACARKVLTFWRAYELQHPGFRDEHFKLVSDYYRKHALLPVRLGRYLDEFDPSNPAQLFAGHGDANESSACSSDEEDGQASSGESGVDDEGDSTEDDSEGSAPGLNLSQKRKRTGDSESDGESVQLFDDDDDNDLEEQLEDDDLDGGDEEHVSESDSDSEPALDYYDDDNDSGRELTRRQFDHGDYYDANFNYASGDSRYAFSKSDRYDMPVLGRGMGYSVQRRDADDDYVLRAATTRDQDVRDDDDDRYYDPNYNYRTGERYTYKQSDRHDAPHYGHQGRRNRALNNGTDPYMTHRPSLFRQRNRATAHDDDDAVTTTDMAIMRARRLAAQEESRRRPVAYTALGDYLRFEHKLPPEFDSNGVRLVTTFSRPRTTTEAAILRAREIAAVEQQRYAVPSARTSFVLSRDGDY
ncbi:hypothetical protein RI367_004248 [Sorochytrium milnesiophthora]